MSGILWALLFNLLLTLAVELGAAAIAGVRGSDLVILALINCVTNPVVNYCFDWIWIWQNGQGAVPYICLAVLEIGVVAVEALLFKKLLRYRKIKPLPLSLLLNGASFAVGELVGLAAAVL